MIEININPLVAILITVVNCFVGAIGAAIFKRIIIFDLRKIFLGPFKAGILFLKMLFIKQEIFNIKKLIDLVDWNFVIGASVYGFSAIFFVLMLKFVDLIVLYPITSVTYVWSLLIGYFYFKEKIPFVRIIGVFFIIAGAIVMTIFY